MFYMVLLRWISSLLHGNWDLCRCWLHYITVRLNYHVSIFKNMGVAANGPHPLSNIAPRDPLLKFLEITFAYSLSPYSIRLPMCIRLYHGAIMWCQTQLLQWNVCIVKWYVNTSVEAWSSGQNKMSVPWRRIAFDCKLKKRTIETMDVGAGEVWGQIPPVFTNLYIECPFQLLFACDGASECTVTHFWMHY